MILAVFLACFVASEAGAARPIVAVFDLENAGSKLRKETVAHLSDYLATILTASGRYTVVPRTQVKQLLNSQKTGSYKACYDEACQIELGKELAAEKAVTGQIMRVGRVCIVNLNVYDLAKAASESAASAKGRCGEESVLEMLQTAAAALSREPAGERPTDVSGKGSRVADKIASLSVLFGARSDGPHFGGQGGSAFEQRCGPGEAVTGLSGSAGEVIDGLATACGRLVVRDRKIEAEGGRRAGAMAGGIGGYYGQTPPAPYSMACGPGEIAVGVRGRAGSFLDQVSLECAAHSIEGSKGTYRLVRGPIRRTSNAGAGGGTPYAYRCPDRSVVVGLVGRAGHWIDGYRVQCAELAVK